MLYVFMRSSTAETRVEISKTLRVAILQLPATGGGGEEHGRGKDEEEKHDEEYAQEEVEEVLLLP